MDKEAEKRERHNQFVTELREQDRWLPINNVGRLMKNTLPVTAKVSKDAKECMQECVSEFISFVTSEANDRCAADKRKTINGEDILISLHALGFENYAEVLKIYLAKYRQQQALKNQLMYTRRDSGSDTDRPQEQDTAVSNESLEISAQEKVHEDETVSNNSKKVDEEQQNVLEIYGENDKSPTPGYIKQDGKLYM